VAKEEPFLFREFPWGTSREEVIAKEGDGFAKLDVGENEMLMYQNIEVGGKNTDAGFIFSPEYGLMGGMYWFRIDTGGYIYNTKPFIDAYSSLFDLLTDIYGEARPGSQNARSKGDDSQDYLEYFFKGGQKAVWESKKTSISLELYPKEAKGFDLADWNLGISYISPQMKESSKEQRKSGL
jgi:hypothetical protein